MPAKWRAVRWLAAAAQIAVTVSLLGWFFHDPDFRRSVAEAVRAANPWWLVAGLVLAAAENLIGVVRWQIFLRVLGIEVGFWKSVQICLLALFCNTFLLGAAGGDLVRAACLVRGGATKTGALLSVTLDRIAGLGGLIVVTLVLVVSHYEWLTRSPAVSGVIAAIVAYQVVAAVIVGGTLVFAARGGGDRLPKWAPFKPLASKLGAGYAQLAFRWRDSLKALGLSVAMLAGYFGVFYCAALAFAAPVGFFELCAIMPAVDMISALPISVGGLGVREKVFTVLLTDLTAVLPATAVSISLAGYLVNSAWGLAGAGAMPFFRGVVREARK